jgi:transcriptional regulator with GAF, ATPase, and Fis domain
VGFEKDENMGAIPIADRLIAPLGSRSRHPKSGAMPIVLRPATSRSVNELYGEREAPTEASPEGIIGQSSALRQVLQLVERVAMSDSTVLLLGETGTGKELIARALHVRSQRKERPLVKLNCAAIPSGLLESELFGHERGAFTGAITQKVGRLELADRGTLVLDEVGIFPWNSNPSCCALCRSGSSSAWEARGR